MILIYKFVNEPGFGDNIRGLITILQVQQLLPFELIIDFRGHVFSKFFAYETPMIVNESKKTIVIPIPSHKLIKHQNDIIRDELQEYFNNYDIITIITNIMPDENLITENIKDKIKQILIVKPEINDYIMAQISQLPTNFNLFHFRLGDNCWYNDSINNDHYIQKILQNKKDNSVLISDSLNLKKQIFDIFHNKDIFVFLNKPCHTNSNIYLNADIYINTLVDFFLIQTSESVSSFSIYGCVSNFVYWTALIYNVPIFKIE
jgi:hypothetical protein